MNWTFWSMGVLDVGLATMGSALFLLLWDIISHIRRPLPDDKK